MELSRKIVLVTTIFSILVFSIWYCFYVAYYAYLSTTAVCTPKTFESDFKNYEVSGSFSANNTNKSSFNITYKYTPSLAIIKHEECHLRQFRQYRLFNCAIPELLYLNEQECYLIQRYYQIFYGS